MLAGYFAAIPVVTRGLMFTLGRLQIGLRKNWGLAGQLTPSMYVSIALFAIIFLLSLVSRRFWCRYLCPSGAVASLLGLLSRKRRTITDACSHCGKCVRHCRFDAINDNYTTRALNCASCRTCAAVCPKDAIRFKVERAAPAAIPTPHSGHGVSRRGVLAGVAGGAVAAVGVRFTPRASLIRPPGSVSEARFLQLCIRCGECFKVCPGSVLQPAGLRHGLDAIWTPIADFTRAGCHQDCNFCTQICPTHAIVPLTIQQKRKAKMGLAAVDRASCFQFRNHEIDCRLCYNECKRAGYNAIELRDVELDVGEIPRGVGDEYAMSHKSAPHVLADACVGCGLCQYLCGSRWMRQGKLARAAIVVR